MKVLMINYTDYEGGAARVAYRLKESLKAKGHVVHMGVGRKTLDDPDIIQCRWGKGNLSLLYWRIILEIEGCIGYQYIFRPGIKRIKKLGLLSGVDVVHIHNLHGGYINLDIVSQLASYKPIIWTFHDMWPLTGHCAHALDCERWKTSCIRCPDLNRYPAIRRDCASFLWRRKAENAKRLKGSGIIVSPSNWLDRLVAESFMRRIKHVIIPNGVDTNIFRPRPKTLMRKELDLPQDRFILCFAAEGGARNPWKGFNLLMDILRRLMKDRPIPYAVIIGNNDRKYLLEDLGFEGKIIGKITKETIMAKYYAASDVYLMTSIVENCPLVIIEALACGLPVLAFNVGGITELIDNGLNGYTIPKGDTEMAVQRLKEMMAASREEREKMSDFAVKSVNVRNSTKTFTSAYEKLYTQVIKYWNKTNKN